MPEPLVAPLTSLRPDPTEPMSARLAALVAGLRDELVEILDGAKLAMPEIDYANEDAWPTM